MRQTYEYYRDAWHERRKRQLLLSALRRPRYQRVFEPDCGFGHLTRALAQRCENVVAADRDELAVAQAQLDLGQMPNVDLSTMRVPEEWPQGYFDLIVLGEFLYYLTRDQIRAVARCALQSLEPNGELIACHWRQPMPESQIGGDEVHAELHAALPLQFALRHQEADFILESWSRNGGAVAPRAYAA